MVIGRETKIIFVNYVKKNWKYKNNALMRLKYNILSFSILRMAMYFDFLDYLKVRGPTGPPFDPGPGTAVPVFPPGWQPRIPV